MAIGRNCPVCENSSLHFIMRQKHDGIFPAKHLFGLLKISCFANSNVVYFFNMGRIFILVGQFGNQLGLELIKTLGVKGRSKRYDDDEKDSFILVDTEEKVIKNLILKAGENISKDDCIFEKIGRGANWSMGYHLQCETKYGMPLCEMVVKTVRRKFESYERLCSGFVIVHSLVGGTGGGLGCAIFQSLRNEFEDCHVTSITTTPFVSGESPLQHYNALLTLAWLQRYADCVLIYHNDEVLNNLLKSSTTTKSTAKEIPVTLNEMNDYICFNVASFLHPFSHQPMLQISRKISGKLNHNLKGTKYASNITKSSKIASDGKETKTPQSQTRIANINKEKVDGINLREGLKQKLKNIHIDDETVKFSENEKTSSSSDTARSFQHFTARQLDKETSSGANENSMVLNNKLKFISSIQRHSKKISSDYKPMLSSIIKEWPTINNEGNKYKNVATALMVHGECCKVFDFNRDEIITKLKRQFVFGYGFENNVFLCTSPQSISGYEFPLSLSLHVNTNRIADFIDHVIFKASLLYQHSAYVHWYTKFASTNEQFDEAFDTLRDVVQEYRDL